MERDFYHYTESGLDNIWLESGFERVNLPSGEHIKIQDIEGLHKVIGNIIVQKKKNLTGKEIRFLRQELLLSQALLSKLLEVSEQTVHRWETGKAEIPKPAEALIRFLYQEKFNDFHTKNVSLRECLDRLADLEDALDGMRLEIKKSKTTNSSWKAEYKHAA